MKKAKTKSANQDDMLPEYDFTGKHGVRGKYYRAYRAGHTVKVYKTDGTVSVQHFKLEEGAVMLQPDVHQYFSNSESVNNALRSLIQLTKLVPSKGKEKKNGVGQRK